MGTRFLFSTVFLLVSSACNFNDTDTDFFPSNQGPDIAIKIVHSNIRESHGEIVASKSILEDERAVQFIQSAGDRALVDCSRDGGETFSSCDSKGLLIWNVSDINKRHIIRVQIGKKIQQHSFVPKNLLPPHITEIVECDETLTQNETFVDFNQRLKQADKVICLDSGVQVQASSAQPEGLRVKASKITILSLDSTNPGLIENFHGPEGERGGLIDFDVHSQIRLVNLNMNYVGRQSQAITINPMGHQINSKMHKLIGLHLTCSGEDVNCLQLGGYSQIEICRSKVVLSGSPKEVGSAILISGVENSLKALRFIAISDNRALHSESLDAEIQLDDSVLSSSGHLFTNDAILFSGGLLQLTDMKLYTEKGSMLHFNGDLGSSTAFDVDFKNVKFIREDSAIVDPYNDNMIGKNTAFMHLWYADVTFHNAENLQFSNESSSPSEDNSHSIILRNYDSWPSEGFDPTDHVLTTTSPNDYKAYEQRL